MTQPDPNLADRKPPAPEPAAPSRLPQPAAPEPPAPEPAELSLGEIERIAAGHHHDPHSALGAHPSPDGVIIRALRPLATSVTAVLDDGRRLPMEHVHQGVFAVTVPDEKVPGYRIAAAYGSGAGSGPRTCGTTRTGTCPRWASSTCT